MNSREPFCSFVRLWGSNSPVANHLHNWNIQTHTITVEDGAITEESATCQPSLLSFDGTCQIELYEAENFTVLGLFALVQRFMEQDNGEWTTITYDETYHFPADIAYNNPDI